MSNCILSSQFFSSKPLSRYHAALKARESSNAKDYAAAEAKAEQLKTHYEDEMTKFEAAKVWMICNVCSS
jgi:hypothetical protein